MLLNGVVGLIRDHGRRSTVLGVHISVKIFDDLGKGFLGLLVQVADGDASGQDGIIWVVSGAVSSCFSCQVVEPAKKFSVSEKQMWLSCPAHSCVVTPAATRCQTLSPYSKFKAGQLTVDAVDDLLCDLGGA